jgi:hypothetical protein
MNYLAGLLCIFSALMAMSGCTENRTAADSGDDMYVVSDGMLAVDTETARNVGIFILDREGQKMTGVVPLRYGFSISLDDGGSVVIESSPNALVSLDSNKDNLIDLNDPVWETMYLAVDYDGDGAIGKGEYALIGECGVDALKIDVPAGQAWSLHTDGETKIVKLPSMT